MFVVAEAGMKPVRLAVVVVALAAAAGGSAYLAARPAGTFAILAACALVFVGGVVVAWLLRPMAAESSALPSGTGSRPDAFALPRASAVDPTRVGRSEVRELAGTMRGEAQRLGAAGADLHVAATSSLAVIEGGAIAQKQLEDGIAEQSQVVQGTQRTVRAMSDAIGELAGSAEQQTRSLDETAIDVSSMSASIEEVAAQVDSLLSISAATTETADRGGTAIHTIVDAMATIRTTIEDLGDDIRRLGANSDQIGDIVKVIDRIAEQTNLLALNAAIEAARAGEHGRGFAVVASEIRKLADGSVQATKEIAGHIGSTQSVIAQVSDAMARLNERVEDSVRSTDSASEALRDIVTTVMDANRQIGQISTVTRSMSENSFRVIRSIEEITRSVAANLSATRQMASHSGAVSSAFESITSISAQNASSVEVLTYVNAEVTSAAQRILGSVEEMTRRAAAIDDQLDRYALSDDDLTVEETAV
jgi:methyl-accepting chemotaxis protein